MVPADMHPGLNPWNGAIRFPEGTEDVNVFFRCQSYITITGLLEGPSCYTTDDVDRWSYTRAIDRAVSAGRATPATVDGQRRRVLTVFSIVFIRRQGTETIALIQNQLLDRDTYGPAYVAAQIYYEGPNVCRCSIAADHFLRYRVRTDGTADVTLVPERRRCQVCLNHIVSGMRFIPGQLDGRSIETVMEVARFGGGL
jgi:hypothetical protein